MAGRVTGNRLSFVRTTMSVSRSARRMPEVGSSLEPGPSSIGLPREILEELRVTIVAGVAYGAIVAGLGSRLAMLTLRLTSPDTVIGVRSDDDFTIGRFTIGGTYALMMLGAVSGVLGAAVYRLVRPSLIGPPGFRRLTTALAAGAVVGSMLVHADGVDFRLLKPTWLAIGLFVALPALFAAGIGPVVDSVESAESWTRGGRRRWLLPTASVLVFPATLVLVPFVATAITVLIVVGSVDAVQRWRATTRFRLGVRAVWLGIAVLGLVALIEDIVDISRVV
jgi:hypothetical protein